MFTRIHPAVSRLTSLMAAMSVIGAGGLAFYLTAHPAGAQGKAAPDSGQPSKEVQELQVDLDDLDTLHVLLPMKFTPEQMDKLVAAISSAKADYDKKYAALSSAPLLKMADEIRETRKKAIAGTTIPSTFDDRVKGIQADFNTKRVELDTANIVSLGAACKAIMNPDQIALCTKMEIDAYKRNKRYSDKATDAQFFNAYVLDVFVGNPRTVPLLKEMRAAKAGK
ncbi:MAG: hypothetical protein JWL77_6121 [Chthonomonadaceae bacterium]|nr:hypothetical protein [Chthonomonadaceae bacterium]